MKKTVKRNSIKVGAIFAALLLAPVISNAAQDDENPIREQQPLEATDADSSDMQQPNSPDTSVDTQVDSNANTPTDSPVETQQPTSPETTAAVLPAEVIGKIHATNQFEIQAGQIAQKRGQSDSVRNYGDRLERDHKFADRRVLSLAASMKMDLPSAPDSEQQQHTQMLQTLRDTPAGQFDTTFLSMMVDGHKKAVDSLSRAQSSLAEDSRPKELVGKLLPILEQHEEVAANVEPGSNQ